MKITKDNLHFISENKTSKYTILKNYEQILMMIEDILGDGETDNVQLYNLGKCLFGNNFLNVYSADTFPKSVKNNQFFIT